jgi:tetratricopeptide (TPR) repeat protein
LAAQITELGSDAFDDAADVLVRGSLLRVLDHDRQRFQIHALLREQLRARMGADGLAGIRKRHAATVEELFRNWETRRQDCAECLGEVLSATECFHEQPEHKRAWNLAYCGFSTARRIGELDIALRLMQQEDRLAEQRGDRDTLQASYGNQALILKRWGRLEEALALHKKEEAICLELGNKDSLANSYGNQALILKVWGRPDEALALLQKVEATAVESGDKDTLQKTYGNQAHVLETWEHFDKALALYKKKELICLELGNRESLAISYGSQASILRAQGKVAEALTLHKKEEELYREIGSKEGLGYCYWNLAELEAARGDRAAQKQKLEQALALFSELKMPRQRDEVQAALDQLTSSVQ